MDKQQDTSPVDALVDVPDPRTRQGQRYPRPLLMLTAALASGQR